jgi:hypothetical protein
MNGCGLEENLLNCDKYCPELENVQDDTTGGAVVIILNVACWNHPWR